MIGEEARWRMHDGGPRRLTLRLTLDEEARMGARIKVIGVGGGGSNAVSRMVQAGISRRRVHGRQHRRAGAQGATRRR